MEREGVERGGVKSEEGGRRGRDSPASSNL